MYCWQIYDRNNKPMHVIDAADSGRSNWLRYVNCARHWREQNLLAYQYQGELYYRTIKTIPRFTELLVFYGSEFANVLNININKYNCDKYYRDLQLSSTPFTIQPHRNNPNNLPKAIICSEKENIVFDSIENKNNKENINIEETIYDIENVDNPYNINIKGDTIKIEFKRNKEIKYTCEICQKTFNTKSILNRHIKIHAKNRGENQLSYQKCDRSTNNIDNFQKNCQKRERRSFYTTPKKCEQCHFETLSRKVLQTHRSKHKGNIYKCHHCEYSNHCKFNLSRHIYNKHRNLF
ncbi:PR domain zinc finger protein 1-like [Trichoplusia ni]|uniref:PR domain zinc finger protein 1-like n=1 Tax=Trichoplusia ni TaxID=7111 RepID=A0A7E5X5K8_TRINI|nr:PR domain zinc finger protein 1-like [Trichoplusia ni]